MASDGMAEDAELLQRWRDGDAAAGNQLFQRCFAPIFRFFVNKTRTLADTEELTQRTFVALMSARERWLGGSSIEPRRHSAALPVGGKPRPAFLTYALGVASHALGHYYRGLARIPEPVEPVDPGDPVDSLDSGDPLRSSIVALGAGAQPLLECTEPQQRLLVALREIPAELQIVLELSYVEALDPGAIGETLGLPTAAVRVRIERARDQLRGKLAELAVRLAAAPVVTPGDDQWAELIRSAFPSRVLSTAFQHDD